MTVQDLSREQLADAIYTVMTARSVIDGVCQVAPAVRETGTLSLTLGELLSEAQRRNDWRYEPSTTVQSASPLPASVGTTRND